jgi:integrase
MRGRRIRVATGIYRDASGYAVIYREAGRPVEKRYPLDTPIARLKTIRAHAIDAAPPMVKAGRFVRDAVRFLAGRKSLASFKSDRAHLRPWIHRFVLKSRFAITREMVREALQHWHRDGYSPRELRHRWRILSQCFDAFEDDYNPCRKIPLPKIPKTRPRSVGASLIREVALNLRKHEMDGIGRLRDAKTRARFLVLATTGQRPAQLRRAKPADVDLERRIWFVDPAKGDAGTVIYLNDDMLAAWQLFIEARAWGPFNQRSFVKTLHRNGWPKGIRPYVLRHTVGLALSEAGVDLVDIQAHMGHTSPATTQRFYVPGVPARLKAASDKLDGRIGSAALVPRQRATSASSGVAKTRQNAPDPQSRTAGGSASITRRARAKTA